MFVDLVFSVGLFNLYNCSLDITIVKPFFIYFISLLSIDTSLCAIMFYRGNIQRRKLLKPRSHKKKKNLNQPEWNGTVQDLTVHAASPEEVLRRQLRHKSKNADVARKEMIAKKRGIPVDLVLSPGQVELEMKKLAILREVLYDQNDFNEVLRKTDQTMASVKTIFHDSVARKSGRPNITLAPGSRLPPPVQPDTEQPSKLDALSDSMMDNKALNEQSSEESEYEDDAQFESKVDYVRFMSLLKDSMSNQKGKTKPNNTDIATTPERGPPVPRHGALNCTEEVKRTLSRISSIKSEDEENLEKEEQKRKIDEVIHGISTIKKDASKLEKDLHNSKATINSSVLPVPNHTQCNLSYDELQGAMANVQNRLKDFETRTGRSTEQVPLQPSTGLAGFTVTLIDSVTRLTTYVNEGELRTQKLEKAFEELTTKFAELVKVNEALAVELVNTQRVIEQDQKEIDLLKKELQELKTNDFSKWKAECEEKLKELSQEIKDVENKAVISEQTLVEGGDLEVEEVKVAQLEKGKQIGDHGHIEIASAKKLKDEEEMALKNDMVKLLTALKSENSKVSATQPIPSGYVYPGFIDNTQDAARTIASVESHLRHLQLQHAEAQHRMNELTKQAQMHAITSSSHGSTISGSVSPRFSSQTSSLASLPIRISGGSKTSMQQSNILPGYDPATFGRLIPDQHQHMESETSVDPLVEALNPTKIQLANDFPEFESVSESFKLLEEDTESNQSQLSSVLSSPHVAEQQQAVLNSIQKTQMSLEDRIAELNRQHNQAQERLQKLVTRRKNDKAKEQTTKKVQISLPSDDMLKTPKQTTLSM